MIAELNHLRDKEAKRAERRRQREESVRFGPEESVRSPARPSVTGGDTPFMEEGVARGAIAAAEAGLRPAPARERARRRGRKTMERTYSGGGGGFTRF